MRGRAHHALVEQQRAHGLGDEDVDAVRGRLQLQLLHAAVHDVDGGVPAVAVHQRLHRTVSDCRRMKGRVEGGVGDTFMSSATLEPSTENTVEAPAMREKKDSLPLVSRVRAKARRSGA